MAQQPNYLKGRRLRIFAGPNGSGKTTILKGIEKKFDIGIYVNADEIDQKLKKHNSIDLSDFGILDYLPENPQQLISSHPLYIKAKKDGYKVDICLNSNTIINRNPKVQSYEAALIADLIRIELLRKGKKFTFETVMSHNSKIEFLKEAKKCGYKNYLYFVSTESPVINTNRIKQRTKLGGHSVNETKIESRYYNSMQLLKDAIKHTYRAFIFDNSEKSPNLVLEIFNGVDVTYKYPQVPKWVDKYILDKKKTVEQFY